MKTRARGRRRIKPTAAVRDVYTPAARSVVARWGETEKRSRAVEAREAATKIERRMRELVATADPVPDPNVLLDHPRIGLELRRLAKEWVKAHAIVWGLER